MPVVKVLNNKRVAAVIGGRPYTFKSTFEYKWAIYLEFLKKHKEIKDWFYEPDTFIFRNEATAPVQYKPDFKIIEKNETAVYQETKGYHNGSTNKKLQRMNKHYPNVIMELVLQSYPSKSIFKPANLKMKDIRDRKFKNKIMKVNRLETAGKYCRRVVKAADIFKQLKGIMNFNIPERTN